MKEKDGAKNGGREWEGKKEGRKKERKEGKEGEERKRKRKKERKERKKKKEKEDKNERKKESEGREGREKYFDTYWTSTLTLSPDPSQRHAIPFHHGPPLPTPTSFKLILSRA